MKEDKILRVEEIVEYVNALRTKRSNTQKLGFLPKGIKIEEFQEAKFVSKPWGFEMWLAHGDHIPYALKMLYIKKGTKTSLQYHHQKMEHNCVFSGTIRFHFEDEKTGNIVFEIFSQGSVIQVYPLTVHRVEALTDVFLVEVSSNHLDDVVRLQDDYKRPNGKIESEHRS